MKINIKRKNGETITYNRAYEVFGRGKHDEKVVVLYPDELDHNVEAEMEYNTDTIDSVVITFTGK